MVTGRTERKQIELEAKLAGLDDELATWLKSSEKEMPLETHNSQIRAVIGSLQVPVEHLRKLIADPSGLDQWTKTERELLRIHEVWDFFRQKLALRDVPVFRPYLDLADEFTWACYEPAQRLSMASGQLPPDSMREPPLTFLGPAASPFAIPRGSSYAQQISPRFMGKGLLQRTVECLPIPVIGVPWFQLRHLPDALVLGHEVGHHVEDDFGLTPTLGKLADAALAAVGAPARHRDRWDGWLGEVFADVYGALAGGLAFGQALADFAMTGRVAAVGSDGYPPVRIRIRVVAEALVRKKSTGLRDVMMTRWSTDFPAERPSVYDDQAASVARALVAGPYPQFGGVPLTGVVDFARSEKIAGETATALLKGAQLSLAIDVRCLLAAAGLAFAGNPRAYKEQNATMAVLSHAGKIEKKGLRATRKVTRRPERDRAAGQSLLALITA